VTDYSSASLLFSTSSYPWTGEINYHLHQYTLNQRGAFFHNQTNPRISHGFRAQILTRCAKIKARFTIQWLLFRRDMLSSLLTSRLWKLAGRRAWWISRPLRTCLFVLGGKEKASKMRTRFVLHRLTGRPIWRDIHTIFQLIRRSPRLDWFVLQEPVNPNMGRFILGDSRAQLLKVVPAHSSGLVHLFPWRGSLRWNDQDLILHKFMMELFHLNSTQFKNNRTITYSSNAGRPGCLLCWRFQHR
jgi:hypothetical protein